MTAQRVRVTWTYHDCRLMPDDGQRYEVIDGDLFVSPSPTTGHQTTSKRLQFALMLQLEERGLGEVFNAPIDLVFSDTRSVQPDLLVVRSERRGIITDRGIEGVPDLIIEILSPSTRNVDLVVKRKLYASEGVPEYWIVDPEHREVKVLALAEVDYQTHGRFGPGEQLTSAGFELEIEVDRIFR